MMTYNFATSGSAVVTITETKVKETGSGKDFAQKYLIFTDQSVFENTDTIWQPKYNSSDLYGFLKSNKGKRVRISYYGWRVPFLSWYPNIYDYKPVAD